MALAQLGGQRHRHQVRQLGARQVVDVVIFGDDVAVGFAVGDGALTAPWIFRMIVRCSSDRSPVLVGDVDHAGCPVRLRVQELAARVAVRDVRHQVERLAGRRERPLEQVVVVGGDDQLVARCGSPWRASPPAARQAADGGPSAGNRGRRHRGAPRTARRCRSSARRTATRVPGRPRPRMNSFAR